MPHEKINHPNPDNHDSNQLVVGWNAGWVSISVFPDGWSDTGDASIVGLPENELDLLIKTLKRAKRKAYGTHVHTGFENTGRTRTEPLWPGLP